MALPVGRRAEVRRASQTLASGQASYPIEYTPHQSPDFPVLATPIAASSSDTSFPLPSPRAGAEEFACTSDPPAFVN